MFVDPAHLKEVELEFDSATDRGAAIVSASFLETLLTEILKNFLITDPKTDDSLWGAYAPLSSFSGKIALSYRLGLISKEEHRLLNIVRQIRNAFAHQLGATFQSGEIQKRCVSINLRADLVAPTRTPMPKADEKVPLPTLAKAAPSDNRSLFRECVFFLFHALTSRGIDVQQRTPLNDFTSVVETMRAIQHVYERDLEKLDSLFARLAASGQPPASQDIDDRKRWDLLRKTITFLADQLETAQKARRASTTGSSNRV